MLINKFGSYVFILTITFLTLPDFDHMYLYEFLHKASFTSTGRFGDPETSKGIYDGLKYKYS